MIMNRAWAQYPSTYRAQELKIMANWIIRGTSSCVVGLPGMGKSNFLGFLCHRPDVIQPLLAPHQIKASLIPVDLNNLPDDSTATFYRVILRAFYEVQEHFDQSLQQEINTCYQKNKAVSDPFLVQSAIRELLIQFRTQQQRVGLVFDRFDDFCQTATPQMTNALRGLRDSFKNTLFLVMGMRQEASYLSDPSALGELYEILDTHVCWVGPMSQEDARLLISQETVSASTPPTESEIKSFLQLSGGFPSLLKTICSWWFTIENMPTLENWNEALLHNPSIDYRLQEIVSGLSQEELHVLAELEKRTEQQQSFQTWAKHHHTVLQRLTVKGLLQPEEERWHIASKLLTSYLARIEGHGRGRIWLDKQTKEVYQGEKLLREFTPLEREVLHFLIQHPRLRHTKTDIIVNAWPDELRSKGVTDDSLYQVIAGLRKKIEPYPTKPCYIVNWRGKPEGGYQLFPEGRPSTSNSPKS